MKGEVTLAKRVIFSVSCLWLMVMSGLGIGETKAAYSVDVSSDLSIGQNQFSLYTRLLF